MVTFVIVIVIIYLLLLHEMPRSSVPKVFRKRNSVGKPKIVVPTYVGN